MLPATLNLSNSAPGGAAKRQFVRRLAAAMSAAAAFIYFLIGFRVVTVLEDGRVDVLWAIFAGAVYVPGIVLLLKFDRREFWIIGAVLQIFVLYTYFGLAGQRAPAFEVWGFLLSIAQCILFFALIYLALRLPPMPVTEQEDRYG